MRRHKYLYDQIVSFQNLLKASKFAQRGKRFKNPTAKFNFQLEKELWRLHKELVEKQYEPGKSYRGEKISGSTPLNRYFTRPKQKTTYIYDFGDSWEHGIVFEKLTDISKELSYPVCIEGENNAPPEDCGGIGGYYATLDAVKDKKHPDHEDLKEWLGEDFDPLEFDIDSINRRLKRFKERKEQPQNIGGFPTEGKILDNNKCLCAVCGKKAKFGSTITPTPERRTIMVLCEQCTVNESAKRHGTTVDEARKDRERMFATQHLMQETFIERYLKESGKAELSSINEAQTVLQHAIKWWNEKLSVQNRNDIEKLTPEEQAKIFLAAPVDFGAPIKTVTRESVKIGRNDPCPCGSGIKFKKCCLEKMH